MPSDARGGCGDGFGIGADDSVAATAASRATLAGMLWVGIGVAVALVLLLIVSLGSKEGAEPAAATAKPLAKSSSATGGRAAKETSPAKKDASSTKEAAPTKDSVKQEIEKLASKPSGSTTTARRKAAEADRKDEEEPEGTKVASVPPPAMQKAKVVDLAKEEGAPVSVPKPAEEAPSVPVEIDHFDDDDPTGPQALILVTAVGRTDPGRRRKHNEDAYLVLPEFSLFVIADGMGGYAAGEVASQLAVEVMGEAYKSKTFVGDVDASRPRRGDELVRSIEMANTAILTQARANEAQHGMGTTVVAARFSPNKQRVYIAHVGDARAYRIRGGAIKQLTTDHTLGAAGITGPAAAKLSRAVGIQDTVEVDLEIDSPQVGDHYMLCSDGLSKMVPDDVTKDIILADRNLDGVVNKLIETANDRGGRDNISVILIRVDEVQKVPSEKAIAKKT